MHWSKWRELLEPSCSQPEPKRKKKKGIQDKSARNARFHARPNCGSMRYTKEWSMALLSWSRSCPSRGRGLDRRIFPSPRANLFLVRFCSIDVLQRGSGLSRNTNLTGKFATEDLSPVDSKRPSRCNGTGFHSRNSVFMRRLNFLNQGCCKGTRSLIFQADKYQWMSITLFWQALLITR